MLSLRTPRLLTLFLAVAVALSACAMARTGQPAPDFRLVDVNDRIVALSELRGVKNVVFVFYVSHT